MFANSNLAGQAVAFVLALVLSAGAFGVTVAPDHNDTPAEVSADMVA